MNTPQNWGKQDNRLAIEVEGRLVRIVTYYWEHKASKELEVGFILYESHS